MSESSNLHVYKSNKLNKTHFSCIHHLFRVQVVQVILVLFVFSSPIYSQAKDKSYYSDISKAMGFYYGTELSLNTIIEQHPELSRRAMQAKLDFEIAHKQAEDQIEIELSENINMNKDKMKEKMSQQAKIQFNMGISSKKEAENFLATFDNDRIKGNNELFGEYVSILLSHNPYYRKYPIKEYTDGYREIFESDGRPKSLGIDFTLEYPKSWKAQKGKHPHILTLIKSSDNVSRITISVKDILEAMEIEEEDLSLEDLKYLKSEEFAEMVNNVFLSPEYGRNIIAGSGLVNMSDYSFRKVLLDGLSAICIKVSGDLIRNLVDVETYNIFYMLPFQNKLITVSAMIIDSNDRLTQKKQQYEHLSELIINSMIFKNRW